MLALIRRKSKRPNPAKALTVTAPAALNTETRDTEASGVEAEESTRLPDGSIIDDNEIEPSSPRHTDEAGTTESLLSLYGRPASPDEATLLCPPGEGGLVWHAQLLTAEDTKFSHADGSVKARRGQLPVRASDFFSSLAQTADGRWVFSGVLNGWPGLTALELQSLTFVSVHSSYKVERVWKAGCGSPPSMPTGKGSVRATLHAPPWTARGYSASSRGFVWWFFAQRAEPEGPLLAHGEDIFHAIERERTAAASEAVLATRVHVFSHRYARGKPETAKDKLTYHSAVLLEWSHGRFATVVELATLHGVGGRAGKSNWCEDKLSERPLLYRHLPACMVLPFRGELAEIRCTDVPATSLDDFKQYVARHSGNQHGRFVDPHFSLSSPVRLYHRSQQDMARYLLNYMGRDRRYTEKVRNCQAFAADFFSFAAGKKGVTVFSSILQPLYTPRPHLFLYDPEMYANPAPDTKAK